ncbi:hypothetical protein FHX37_3668 [Haloactinospora alba]|uniref:Uncharacterized protein n=1 Tax=Haloactinospora alba TaxID=405555 RepID=A0A543N924_9ACTN|nr:hypothetical protein FHX37_3668 [Haloactinospora alba]
MTEDKAPLLRLLQEHYGHRWRIRCTEELWIATVLDTDTDSAPTIIEHEIEKFVRQLENPPHSAGQTSFAARWLQSELE